MLSLNILLGLTAWENNLIMILLKKRMLKNLKNNKLLKFRKPLLIARNKIIKRSKSNLKPKNKLSKKKSLLSKTELTFLKNQSHNQG